MRGVGGRGGGVWGVRVGIGLRVIKSDKSI
jgi:hypothetical protein